MAKNSNIQWTTHTFNPWRGCVEVSPACDHCYARTLAGRNPKVLGRWGNAEDGGTRVLASEAQWHAVRKWNADAHRQGKKELVFCASLADVMEDFDGQMSDSQGNPLWFDAGKANALRPPIVNPATFEPTRLTAYTLNHARARLWELVGECPNLIFQILTKRPENYARFMPLDDWPNVWLGCTLESMSELPRLDQLLEAPQQVPVMFLSCEPLLGPLSLWERLQGIQWLIVGGESGGSSRELKVEWVRDLIQQCQSEAVPIFVKQMGRIATDSMSSREVARGAEIPEAPGRYRLELVHDRGHGGDVVDWPADIIRREFPVGWFR